MFWAFWCISAWRGQWSKVHAFKNEFQTLCGRIAHPQYGEPLTRERNFKLGDYWHERGACGTCLRIARKL